MTGEEGRGRAARRLLVVQAHPDDESFLAGGTLALSSRAGVACTIVCATRGEAGKAGDPPVCPPEELPRVREAEFRAAAAILGVSDVRLLPYRDRELAAVDADPAGREAAVERLVAELDRVRPQVVITFPPGGLSGHPDHQVIHRWTAEAFGRAASRPGAGWAPAKLYYWTIDPRSFRAAGRTWHHPLDSAVTTVIDISPVVQLKIAALRTHRTQHLAVDRFFRRFPPDIVAAMSREWFYRAVPPWPGVPGAEQVETDLWNGIPSA